MASSNLLLFILGLFSITYCDPFIVPEIRPLIPADRAGSCSPAASGPDCFVGAFIIYFMHEFIYYATFYFFCIFISYIFHIEKVNKFANIYRPRIKL